MRIWIISDLHFGIRNNNIEWLNNIYSYFINFFIPLLEKYKENDDKLFILGDVFNNRQVLNVLVINYALGIFKKLSQIIPIYILTGNHDIYYKNNTKINSLKILKQYAKIYTKTVLENFNNKKILIMPWSGDFDEEERLIIQTNCDYIFCHTQIKNINFNNIFLKFEDGLDFEKIKDKKIFSGHIHLRRHLNENIIYVGCPYHLNRNDINDTKGVYLLNLKNDEIKFFENNYSPKFIRKKLRDCLELTVDEFKQIIKNNYIDLILDEFLAENFSFNLFNEYFKNIAKNINFEIETDEKILNEILHNKNNVNLDNFNNYNMFDYLIEFVREKFNNKEIENEIIKLYNSLEVLENEN